MLIRATQAAPPSTKAEGSEEGDRGAREGLVCPPYRSVVTMIQRLTLDRTAMVDENPSSEKK